jgi:hypothetical protein
MNNVEVKREEWDIKIYSIKESEERCRDAAKSIDQQEGV